MKPSRHVHALLRRVARDFICASAEGLGVGVAVTRRELITCKMRLFGRALLRRYRVRDIDSVWLRRGQSVGFLMIELMSPDDATLMILFSTQSLADFEAVTAALERLARPRSVARHTRRPMVVGAPGRAVAAHNR